MALAGRVAAQEPAWDAWVESEVLPIRVLYTTEVGETTAREALGYAEEAWQEQIDGMGFTAPHTVDESGDVVEGLSIYLDPDAPTNHTEPLADIEDTPSSDCAARVVIPTDPSPELPPDVHGLRAEHRLRDGAPTAPRASSPTSRRASR